MKKPVEVLDIPLLTTLPRLKVLKVLTELAEVSGGRCYSRLVLG